MISKFLSMLPGSECKLQTTANTHCLQVHTLQFLLFREESLWQYLCNTLHVPQHMAI